MLHKFPIITCLGFIFLLANCEKKDDTPTTSREAEITAFHAEKLYCWWGWEIKTGSEIIRADSIPQLKPLETTAFPVRGQILIGKKTRTCSSGIDYYEIKGFIPEK